jgi:hypothetical protein
MLCVLDVAGCGVCCSCAVCAREVATAAVCGAPMYKSFVCIPTSENGRVKDDAGEEGKTDFSLRIQR